MRGLFQGLESAEKSGSRLSLVYAHYSLGIAHCAAGNWKDAAGLLERALEISDESGAATLEEPSFLARLAHAYGALGDSRARETAERALALARERRLPLHELTAEIMRARVLRLTRGADGVPEIDAALANAETLVNSTGLESWRPYVHEERAELAAIQGDATTRERELREAQRLFSEMGATRHVERIEAELGD